MDQFARSARGAGRQIPLLDQSYPEAAAGGIEGTPAAHHTAPDHEDVEGLRFEPDQGPITGVGSESRGIVARGGSSTHRPILPAQGPDANTLIPRQTGSMTVPSPGTGYFVGPIDSPGPGVLVLHSWWGLNRATKGVCDRLADAGYTTLAPDLGDGALPSTTDEARETLADADMNVVASLVQSSARLLRTATADPDLPIAVLGYSSGASWALWLSSRSADDVGAVVTFYGSQSIPLDASRSAYQCHFAERDELVTDLEKAELGLTLTEAGRPFEFHHYPDTTQWFAEEGIEGYDGAAEAIAWRRTLEFLATHLPTR